MYYEQSRHDLFLKLEGYYEFQVSDGVYSSVRDKAAVDNLIDLGGVYDNSAEPRGNIYDNTPEQGNVA